MWFILSSTYLRRRIFWSTRTNTNCHLALNSSMSPAPCNIPGTLSTVNTLHRDMYSRWHGVEVHFLLSQSSFSFCQYFEFGSYLWNMCNFTNETRRSFVCSTYLAQWQSQKWPFCIWYRKLKSYSFSGEYNRLCPFWHFKPDSTHSWFLLIFACSYLRGKGNFWRSIHSLW